jgi:hypothetical protein
MKETSGTKSMASNSFLHDSQIERPFIKDLWIGSRSITTPVKLPNAAPITKRKILITKSM